MDKAMTRGGLSSHSKHSVKYAYKFEYSLLHNDIYLYMQTVDLLCAGNRTNKS